MSCILCQSSNERILVNNELFRVIMVHDDYYPGFIRIILNKHKVEMSDLSEYEAMYVLRALLVIERIMRRILKPDKINLASLGNVVPHVHWHIIPRYKNDRHFPNPIWSDVTNHSYRPLAEIIALQEDLIQAIVADEYFKT